MKLSVEGMGVFLAIPVNRDFPWQFENSMIATIGMLKDRGIPYVHQLLVGSSIIETARSNLAHLFLKTKMNRLFWIDSDMGWKADDFLRILALTSKMSVVGAAYPAKRGPNIEFLMNIEAETLDANEWGCMPIPGMGLGFTCVERTVIEQLTEPAPKIRDDKGEMIPQIFHAGVAGDKFVGEDMNFFADAARLGHPLWVDPMIELDHIGSKEYRGKLMDTLQQKKLSPV